MTRMTKRARKTGRQERRVKKSRKMKKKKRSPTACGVVSRSMVRKAGRKAHPSTKTGRRKSR